MGSSPNLEVLNGGEREREINYDPIVLLDRTL
jgi:hypothetical protein